MEYLQVGCWMRASKAVWNFGCLAAVVVSTLLLLLLLLP